MAEDNKTPEDKKAEEKAPPPNEQKKINEDYANASPKARKKDFTVDPVTKTLRRAK
jgi:hypothetical protein